MPAATPILHDVLIAGAGPVGLFLACELALAGVPVLVLERAGDPRSPLKAPPFGVRGLTVPTLEALDRRGLLDPLKTAQDRNAGAIEGSAHWAQQPRRPAGHFAGLPFFREDVDETRWPHHRPGPAGATLAVDLQSLEAVLAERAIALGVEIRRGLGVDGLQQTGDTVIVHAGGETLHTRWLVGCDGGRSTVRKAGGFDFVGTDPEFTGYSIDAELADPDVLTPGRVFTPAGMYTYARPGVIAVADFDGGAFHRTEPITREHVEAVLRRVSGAEVRLTALRLAATWTDGARQAGAYRRGRVLLAGDAAHVHSPLGGQGLNLGLGDAMNLGWKLAAEIQGEASSGLLDSYCTERHPEGARILDWSRAQVALMRPTPATRALAALMRDLLATRDGATHVAERVWGVSLRYDLGGHPLVGRSAPDLVLADGRRVAERLRDGRGLLLDFAPGAPLQALAGRWRERLDYAAAPAQNGLGLSALLVRPDGFVAWVSEAPATEEEAAKAASAYFKPAS